jgi:hypothetical protein
MPAKDTSSADAAAIAAALWHASRWDRHSCPSPRAADHDEPSRWKLEARREQLDRTP